MGLERRDGTTAYYKKQRINGRVVSIYVASGEAAVKLYQQDRAKREAEEKRQADLTSIADLLGEWIQKTEPIISQGMEELGYHYHRGEWRKRRSKS